MSLNCEDDLCARPAHELADLIRQKAVTPVEVLKAHLRAIERINPKVNAICTLDEAGALQAARDAELAVIRNDSVGLLHGLPIGIKDVTPTAGIRTTFGSELYADHIPEEDALVVKRLRKAGAIIVGKTNTPEFAAGANTVNELFGATRNPWNLALTVGGSTGGGAAAVACGMLPLAEGTDFGGSLRVPAAFCGVVGLRPTVGLVPTHPAPQPWDWGRTHGPIARNVEDIALMLDAIIGLSKRSPISVIPPWHSALEVVRAKHDLKNYRIAYVPDIAGVGVDAEIAQVGRAATKTIASEVASVEEIALDMSDGRDAYRVLRGQWMVNQYFAHTTKPNIFGANLAGNIKAGLELSAIDIAAAENTRAHLWQRWCDLFQTFDFVLTPTTPVPPFPVEQNYPETIDGQVMRSYIDWIAPTFLVTLCTLPALSVPCGLLKCGAPVGMQIVSRRFSEPQMLSLARVIQELNPIGRPQLVDNA